MGWKTYGAATLATLAFGGGAGGAVIADDALNPYTEKGERLEIVKESTIPDAGQNAIEVHTDRPAVTFQKWNGEVGMTVSYNKVEAEGARAFLTDRVEWKGGKEEVHAYPLEPTTQMEDGGFEIEVVLNEKPDTNVFEFQIQGAENLDFFYQPELTSEEIAGGSSRPENVIGSYAVYHKEKANHEIGATNYATGKAYHIFRPKAIDASGAEMWAKLSYIEGKLSVTVPQEWLDTAAYPVRVDPTFGYSTVGASGVEYIGWVTSDTSRMIGRVYTFNGSATLSSLHAAAYLQNDTAQNVDLFIGIYDENSAGADSHGLVASTESLDQALTNTPAFTQINAASESLTANRYILAVLANGEDVDGTTIVRIANDTGSSQSKFNEETTGAGSYATRKAENPWTFTGAASTQIFSIYATYACTTCTETFTESGDTTWVAPEGVFNAAVACWGGGGGGFDDTSGTNAGAGGGGGAFASSTLGISPGTTYTFTIASSSAEGTGGKDSYFASATDVLVRADGGTGATSATANGVGGTVAGSTGDVEFAGGVGGDAVTTDDTGGGGGGAAGPNGAGGAAANGQAATGGGGGGGNNGGAASGVTGGTAGPNAGAGGDGVTTTYSAATSDGVSGAYGGGGGGGGDNGTQGGNGGAPGGGGGGAEGDGGTGAGGQCTITYTIPADTTPLQQIIIGGSASAVSSSAYSPGAFGSLHNTSNQHTNIFPVSGTISNFIYYIDIAPTAGTTRTGTIRKLGATNAATAMACTITEGNTSCTDTDAVAVEAGQHIDILPGTSGSPPAGHAGWSFVFTPDNPGDTVIMGAANNGGFSGTYNSSLVSVGINPNGITPVFQTEVMPTSGTIDMLYASTSRLTNGNWLVSFIHNSATSTLQCHITSASCLQSTTTIAIATGDTVSMTFASSSASTSFKGGYGVRFTPTNPGDFVLLASTHTSTDTANATRYFPVSGATGAVPFTAEASSTAPVAADMTVTSMQLLRSAAPGVGFNATVTLRVNNADSALACTLTGSGSGDGITTKTCTGSVDLVAGDLIDYSIALTSGGTVGTYRMGLVATMEEAAPPAAGSAVIETFWWFD